MGEMGSRCFGYLPRTFDRGVLGYTRLSFYDVQAAIQRPYHVSNNITMSLKSKTDFVILQYLTINNSNSEKVKSTVRFPEG